MAFRRADAAERGPLDERFRFYRNLDIWWSLVLRDEGEASRRAAPSRSRVPAVRHEHRGWSSLPEAERDRLSKRNFYRIIDRFGWRRDLPRRTAGRGPVSAARLTGRRARRSTRPARARRAADRSASAVAKSPRCARGRALGEQACDRPPAPSPRRRLSGPARSRSRPEHEVGIEHEPAPLVGREVGPERLAHDRQRGRQVEVVVERGDEAIVERPTGVGQRRRRRVGTIAQDAPPDAVAVARWTASTVPLGRSAAAPARRIAGRGPRPVAAPARAPRARPGARRAPAAAAGERLVGVLELVAVARRQAQVAEGEGIDARARPAP